MDKSLYKFGRQISIICSTIVFAISVTVMLGWQFESDLLKSIIPGYITMKFNTAFALCCFSISIFSLSFPKYKFSKFVATTFTLVATTVALLTAIEYIYGVNIGIDELIYKDLARIGGKYPPGRLAPVTAINAILLGLSIFVAHYLRRPKYRFAQLLAIVAFLISFQALVGYALGIDTSFGFASHTRIAIHTAVSFILLSVGTLSLTNSHGYIRIVFSKTQAGKMARTLISAAIIVPPLVNMFEKMARHAGIFDDDFGTLIKVVSSIMFFVIMVWRSSEILHRSEREQNRRNRFMRRQTQEKERYENERKISVAIHRSEARFRAIFNSSFNGIINVNKDGQISDWNPKAESIFGWDRHEVLGKDLGRVIFTSESVKQYNDLISTNAYSAPQSSMSSIEIEVVRNNGERFPAQFTLSRVHVENVMFTISVEDISERKKNEKELLETREKALEGTIAKSQFLANMSHEIRTPLNGIIGMSKILSMTSLNIEQKNFVDTISTSSDSLLEVINEILDFSKIESGKIQIEKMDFNLPSLIQNTISIVHLAAERKNLKIVVEVDADIPEFLHGDSSKIRQILINLINNSIKFTQEGPVVLKITRKCDVNVPDAIRFEVADRGIGLSESEKEKLFMPFSQVDGSTSRKYGGTGLGLVISKQIVEAMGGRIDVHSIKGIGSKFFFEIPLPLGDQKASKDKKSSTIERKNLAAHILVAEDVFLNQKVIIEMLKFLGCTCKIAGGGLETLEILKNENFDMILMDIQMPGIDGLETTRRIRNGICGVSNTKIPIVATTASAVKHEIDNCFTAGMDDYLSKPLSLENLASKIERWTKIIDDERILNLEELAKQGDKDLVAKIVHSFSEDFPKQLIDLKVQVTNSNLPQVRKAVHAMKSGCASLGVGRVVRIIEQIEQTADISLEDLKVLIDSIEYEYEKSLRILQDHVQSSSLKKAV